MMRHTLGKSIGIGGAALIGMTLLVGMARPLAPVTMASASTVPLVVENDNFLDVHIYAVRGDVFHSVGFVTSFNEDQFELSDAWVGPGDEFRLFADPIGGIGGYLSEPIVVGPNSTIVFRVKESLNLSNVTIRASD